MKAIMLAVTVIFMSFSSFANWDLEERKINYLLQSIEQLNARFVRSGVEYSGKEAAKHLRRKMNSAFSGPFGPGQDDVTAEMFIDKLASTSYFSGDAYLIRFEDGQSMTAREWLYQQLNQFQP